MLLSLQRSEQVWMNPVNYCQFGHLFKKNTCVWSTIRWAPKGRSGNGLCREATGYCGDKLGYIHPESGRWRHRYVIGGDHTRSVKGKDKDELQNRVPAALLAELLQALVEMQQ